MHNPYLDPSYNPYPPSVLIATTSGALGSHQELLDDKVAHTKQLYIYEKSKYTYQVVGTAGLCVIKLSILLFYRRIFTIGAFRLVNNALIGVTIAWGIAFTFTTVFQCTPVSTVWNKFEVEYGTACLQVHPFYFSIAISDLILDVLIYFLPIPHLWQLHLPMREKLSVLGIFLLGSIVIAIGITRAIIFHWVISFSTAQPLVFFSNIMWYTPGTLFWHLAENVVGLLACCLPSYASPVRVLLKTRKMTGASPNPTRANSRTSPWRSPYHQNLDDQVKVTTIEAGRTSHQGFEDHFAFGYRHVPFAIVWPSSEQDVVSTVQEALNASGPFVPTSGARSPWSTIGHEGIVIDLSGYKGVSVDAARNLATVRGGTLMKELQSALHPHKQFAAVANGNTVGVIPYYIGGGISIYTPFTGYGSENIISAKLVNSKGELMEVSESRNPEVVWGLRGAGQFLGLATEITIETYPYSLLGNDDGARMCGTYVFLPQLVDAVCAALEAIMSNKSYVSAVHFMIVQAPPDLKQQALLTAPQVFCSAEEAAKLFQPLVDVGPLQEVLMPSTFDKHSDHLEWICAKGNFKRFSQAGLAGWSTEKFMRLIELHAELVQKFRILPAPVTRSSGRVRVRQRKSYSRLSDARTWNTVCKLFVLHSRAGSQINCLIRSRSNVLSWYTDSANHDFVAMMDRKAQVAMRVGTEEGDSVSYTNTTRDDPLEYRYKGADRIRKLKALKNQLDPTGIFTPELL
ncbi:hypothetical protein DL768_005146 [Monosporascus sp. mg162]|nr:hypothetical protein DL768_005146 [Monosporascus sp. mg162]